MNDAPYTLKTACCGTMGCAYALVQGIMKKWKHKKNIDGQFVTRLSCIENLV